MGVLDALAAVSRARREVVLILDSALEAEWLDLKDKLVEAADEDVKTGDLTLPATTVVVNGMEAIRARVEASEVTFTFEQLDWTERVDLQVAHPPRENNPLDAMRGFNIETFTPAIIRVTCVGARQHGELGFTPVPDDTWDSLLPRLSFGQIERLYLATTLVNDGVAQVPVSTLSLLDLKDPVPAKVPAKPATRDRARKAPAKKATPSR